MLTGLPCGAEALFLLRCELRVRCAGHAAGAKPDRV